MSERQRSLLEQAQAERPPLSRYTLLIVCATLFVVCLVVPSFLKGRPTTSWRSSAESEWPVPRLVTLIDNPSAAATAYLAVQPGSGDIEDIYLCATRPLTSCANLTDSPAIAEIWPTTNMAQDHIAYYGMTEGGGDLYIMDLNDKIALPVTTRAGNSGLHDEYKVEPGIAPTFSPSGAEIAFCTMSSTHNQRRLFIARADGSGVLPVEEWHGNLIDAAWVDDNTLIVAIQYTQGDSEYRHVRATDAGFSLTERP